LQTKWAKDVSPDKVLPEYPRPQMVREKWQNLNGLWDFAVGAEKPANFTQKILVPFPVESSLSGIGKMVDGPVWCRRTFKVTQFEDGGPRTLLHFGAVNWESAVWLNGKKLGEHKGGYDGFSFDITNSLKEGENELLVRAINPADKGTQPRGKQVNKPGGIFYTPSTGIWQTVWLEPVGQSYIESVTISPIFQSRKVEVFVKGHNTKASQQATVTVEFQEKPNAFTRVPISGEVSKPMTLDLSPFFHPWSPESPFLYRVEVKLEDRSDFVESYFAFRKIEIGKDDNGTTRILLNGKPYFQAGPLDQGFWPDGIYTAPTDEALKYDIEITKKLGFNMIRKHVKVEPDRWYYWCDKLGMLVWQDMPSGDKSIPPNKPDIQRSPESAKQYETELKAMIDGLRNHPSIVMWVVFNEGWGQFDTKRITEWTKKYDPTRLVNCASGWQDRGVGDVHDWHVYPGPGSPQPEANRAAVLGEFGGLGLATKDHMWTDKHWGYQGTRDSADLTRKYERLLEKVYELKEKPGLSAIVYTQTTDVETEANGLLTYDRAVIKVDLDRVAAANRGDFSKLPKINTIVGTAKDKAYVWHYSVEKPTGDWFKPDFDDSKWKEGESGFGTKGTPGAVVRTEWKTDDIWIRREFTLRDQKFGDMYLNLHHDEDAEIYFNGVLAAKVKGFKTEYELEAISSEAKAALKPGKNIMAIHCHQTTGGQYIDAGLVELK
jgi:hypothetical protein